MPPRGSIYDCLRPGASKSCVLGKQFSGGAVSLGFAYALPNLRDPEQERLARFISAPTRGEGRVRACIQFAASISQPHPIFDIVVDNEV